MGDVKKVVVAILLTIGALISVIIFLQARGKFNDFIDDPNKISPPGKAVYSDLKEGTYYIYIMSQHAFRGSMHNLDLIDGMEFRVSNLTDNREIVLEDITGRGRVHFGKRSARGLYSVRKFRLDWGGDIELEVSGGWSENNDSKVFISRSKMPGMDLIYGAFGRIFLLFMVLGVLQIVIMKILKRLGVVVH